MANRSDPIGAGSPGLLIGNFLPDLNQNVRLTDIPQQSNRIVDPLAGEPPPRGVHTIPIIPLPYTTPRELLPADLPSLDEIESPNVRCLSNRAGCRVVVVKKHYVVKYGTSVSLVEAQSMDFARRICGQYIRVPRVYAACSYADPADPVMGLPINYIVMEHIHGCNLADCWRVLTPDKKIRVSTTLAGYMAAIGRARLVDSQGNAASYFGSVSGQRFTGKNIFWKAPNSQGPFVSAEAWVDSIMATYRQKSGLPKKYLLYRPLLNQAIREPTQREPVFTHGDVRPKNLMLHNDGTLVLLDWASAGWYPPFWEFLVTLTYCPWGVDEGNYIGPIIAVTLDRDTVNAIANYGNLRSMMIDMGMQSMHS